MTSRTPTAGATGVAIATSVAATFSEPVQSSTIAFTLKDSSNVAVAATLSYNATTRVATLTPSSPFEASTTYTASLSGAKDTAGNVMAPLSWSFATDAVPAPPPATTTTIWPASATPAVASFNDTASVELGVKFRSDAAGTIAGVRFYKGAANTGTHLGRLWSSTGTLLATATFAGETESGWQEVRFASAVAIAANTTYVVSYYAPSGGYAASGAYFASAGADSGPLHALASGVDGGNGVFRYGVGGGFPTRSFNATNYWVDVVFSTAASDETAPTVTSRTPAAGATGVAIATSVAATFSEPVQSSTIAFTLKDSSNVAVAATLSYNATTRVATLTPSSPFEASTTYTASLSGAKDTAGNVMAPLSWSFTTSGEWTQTSALDFAGGTHAATTVTNTDGGEIQVASSGVDDFDRSSLGDAWTVQTWVSGGNATLSAGRLSLRGSAVFGAQSVDPGQGIEAKATLQGVHQHIGLANGLSSSANSWAIFSTMGTTNSLYARVNSGGAQTDVRIGTLPDGLHTYRVQPIATGYQFLVDGVVKATISRLISASSSLKAAASAYATTTPLEVDWIDSGAYATAGTYTSSIYDAKKTATWGRLIWTADVPSGTSLLVETSSSTDGTTWTTWKGETNGSHSASPAGRYFRYRVLLKGTSLASAKLRGITFLYS